MINPAGFLQAGAQDITPRAALGMLGAASMGAQDRRADQQEERAQDLHGIVLRQQENVLADQQRERAKEAGIKVLADEALASWKAGDNDMVQKKIREMAFVNPTEAEAFSKSFGTMDRTRFVQGAYNLYAAARFDGDIEAQNQQLEQAAKAMGSEEGHAFGVGLQDIADMPYDTPEDIAARREQLFTAVNVAKELGAFPTVTEMEKNAATKAGASVDQIRKETRAQMRKDVVKLGDQAQAVADNYRKITGLSDEIRKGNRTATAQALVAIVKLGDPTSTVREGEMQMALNAENPISAVMSYLKKQGAGADVSKAIQRSIDPLNPNLVNVEDIIATADALVKANVPSIQSRFAEAKGLGERNLTPEGYASIFDPSFEGRVNDLSTLIGGGGEARTAVDVNGTVFTEQPDGSWVDNNGNPYRAPAAQ